MTSLPVAGRLSIAFSDNRPEKAAGSVNYDLVGELFERVWKGIRVRGGCENTLDLAGDRGTATVHVNEGARFKRTLQQLFMD